MNDRGTVLPKQGVDRQVLLDEMRVLRDGDVDWEGNRAFGLVYHHSKVHTDFIREAHGLFFSTNGLNPMAFRSLQKMEHGVVRTTVTMLHGDDEVVGTMTSGGTESILLAMLTYRQYARKTRPWITRPEIVVPESAHAAFYKAGEYFDMRIVKTPLQSDYRADPKAMAACINDNTIGLVGSAACYPYGVIDPIEDLAALALKHDLPLHVDGCIGGFMVPFVEQLREDERLSPIPPFDFRVPGVTSMSADVHKYGYAAKGASTVMYRGMKYLRCQISAATDWCGGVYASPTLAGTRPGAAIAAAWASLQALGEDGLLENARATMAVTRGFRDGIEAIPELQVFGKPAMSILAYGSKVKGFSTYAVGDFLESRGWHLDRLQVPEALHLIINPGHAQILDQYLADLRDGVEYVKSHPDAAFEGSAPMYGLIAKAPMRRMVKNQVIDLIAGMYTADGEVPDIGPAPEGAEEGALVAPPSAPGVPKPVIWLMKLKARLGRLVGA
ncbi:MAG: aminotransferase class V-fold PLP-dependent enzyme [Nitrospiraceae bacterium]|nr:aminotransferase class V-fold PLP-dependent enzyme [Nitrospiraceae bacterium]